MKKGFIPNENYLAFRNALKIVENRGADEASLLLVTGEPGLGKTRAVDRYASETNAMYIRASSVANAKGLMMALASTDPSLPQKGSALQIQQAIIKLLGKTRRPLIVDECQNLANGNAKMLEAIRDITDMTGVIGVLVAGDPDTESKIAQFPQIRRRISAVVEFKPLTFDDVVRAVKAMTEIRIDDALCAELHKQSDGKMGLIINGVAELEQFAISNERTSLTRADIGNRSMCYQYSPAAQQGRKK